jgi:hypothetical protein
MTSYGSPNAQKYDFEGMEIARGVTVADWKKLDFSRPEQHDSEGWCTAMKVFELRIRRRFIEPIDALIRIDALLSAEKKATGELQDVPTYGFAILALDCALIETLQGFLEGSSRLATQSRAKFKSFLMQASTLKRFFRNEKAASEFYDNCRNALLHQGATEGAFLVKAVPDWTINGKTVGTYLREPTFTAVNRTLFHEAIVKEFELILKQVSMPPRNESDKHRMKTLRLNIKSVMDKVCGING